MATTVTGTRPLTKTGLGGSNGGPNGNGSPKRNGNGRDLPELQPSASRYRIGVWVGIASILMMFTALSSAYIVRAASATDWRPLVMPRVLLLSTTLILISSATLEIARRKLKAHLAGYKPWLLLTVLLGVGFLVSQVLAWRQLVRQGIYMAGNPHSSFFYLFTAAHAVHLFGGLTALAYLLLRTRVSENTGAGLTKGQAGADAVTLYWHFMDFLWIYLFVLLFFVR